MSSPESPSDGAILKELSEDAPVSPLVGLLRNRLNMDAEAATADVDHDSHSGRDCTEFGASPSHSRQQCVESGTFSIEGCSKCSSAEVRESPGNGASFRERKEKAPFFESFVLIHNVAKKHNMGTISRSATAFGVSELILVGRNEFTNFGSHGADAHIQKRHFHTLPEAKLFLKAKDVDVCGVEIVDGAHAVHTHPFKRSTAFMLGNEGTGLSKKEMEICDFFVYIPQIGPGTASLNVTVAGSIVLHHFSVWAGFAERERQGHKFVVAERPVRRTPRNVVGEDPDAVKERRRQRADDGPDDWLLCEAVDANDDSDVISDEEPATSVEFPATNSSTIKTHGLLSVLNNL